MHDNSYLFQILILLAAAVVAVPVFRRIGLGTVLGYLFAGITIGPWGLGLIKATEDIRHIAEFGVIFLLFLIGIELKPSRLWRLRKFVFGLGSAQVIITGLVLTGTAWLFGFSLKAAVITGFALALSSTAFAIQILTENRALNTQHGRTTFSILLLQDLAVIPLLTLVSLLAEDVSLAAGLEFALLDAVIAISLVFLTGRYLLNPFLRIVASSRTSEVFVAAAVLAILGTAVLMEKAGLSMALGAFLAGLMLSESHFRHQITADIMPFRAILLGLFFMSVGMSIDFGLLAENAFLIFGLLFGLLIIKILVLLMLTQLFGAKLSDGMHTAVLLSQSGEFAFILFGLATLQGVMQPEQAQLLTVVVALSMASTPLLVKLQEKIDRQYISRSNAHPISEINALESPPQIIIAGFGRVGRRVAKLLDRSQTPYVALDSKAERIARLHAAGVPVFFGDASRSDVLHAAGAAEAKAIVITLDDFDATERLVGIAHEHYPNLKIFARAHNQEHCRKLHNAGATLAISETMETSVQLGSAAMDINGFEQSEILQIVSQFRDEYYAEINPEWDKPEAKPTDKK